MEGQSRSDLEEIRSRANIVEIVSEYVNLKKTGRNYVGLCPFHKEKSPSFSVNPEKQIFYCFGCGEGGDVFSFLMKVNNTEFPEMLQGLAGKLGVSLRSFKKEDGKQKSLRDDVLGANKLASEFFTKCLYSNSGKIARDYIKKRGFGEEIVKEFRLGYAPDGWRNLKARWRGKKFLCTG